MEDGLAHPSGASRGFALPAGDAAVWKGMLSHLAALAVAILFITAGVWKIMDPFTWRTMVEQLQVWYQLSLPLTVALAVSETFAGVLILVPRFRRWGAWLAGVLLVVFMIYAGINYSTLVGKECSCFPWIKRTIGPGFFVGDLAMLAAALIAGLWARPAEGKRSAAVILGAVMVFAGVSLGVAYTRQFGVRAPDSISVEGQPFSLQQGRIFLYFYDPQCSHCEEAAKRMSAHNWRETKLVAIPTQSRFAREFLNDTGLKAGLSTDLDLLKQTFPFRDPPYAVLLESGRLREPFSRFDEREPAETLRKLGAIE